MTASKPSVIMYTVTGCPFCKRAKDLLQAEGVVFEERDVATNEKWYEVLMDLIGRALTPVTLIAGETIIGYDEPKLKTAIARLKQHPS
jgi:thioredoxin reductase (NADPH)